MAKKPATITAPVATVETPVALNPIETQIQVMSRQIADVDIRIGDQVKLAEQMTKEANDLQERARQLREGAKKIDAEIAPDRQIRQQFAAALQALQNTPKAPSGDSGTRARLDPPTPGWHLVLIGRDFKAADVAEVLNRDVANVRNIIRDAVDAGMFKKISHGVFRVNEAS